MKISSIKGALVLIALIGFFAAAGYRQPADVNNFSDLPETPAQLGAVLFFDPILSYDYSVSCASCHKPEFAFADNSRFSVGVDSIITGRNTPSITYMKGRNIYFWDGRAHSLEDQARQVISNPNEMRGQWEELMRRFRESEYYSEAFMNVFFDEPDTAYLFQAIADYQRTLSAYDSPYDRYIGGDESAMSESAIRGMNLYFKHNTCGNVECHAGVDLSNDSIVNIGVHNEDPGLYEVTGLERDRGKFKTPHLRNIAITAPYMHDGSMKTLREVMVYYNNMDNFPLEGPTHNKVKRQRARPLNDQEIDDIIAFMKALTDQRYADKLEELEAQEARAATAPSNEGE